MGSRSDRETASAASPSMRIGWPIGLLAVIAAWVGCREIQSPAARTARVEIMSARSVILMGDTLRLVAVAYDEDDKRVEGVTVTWESQDTSVIRMDSLGLVYGRAPGLTLVRAVVGRAHAALTLMVDGTAGGWRSADWLCGIWQDMAAYCWSFPGVGGSISIPVAVDAPPFEIVRYGPNHGCGLSAGGETYCWGRNNYGQVGDGTTIDRTTPVPVAPSLRFDSITVGALHTCAITAEGQAYCWGGGRRGQLGIGNPQERCNSMPCATSPAAVAGNHRFRTIAAGGDPRPGGPAAEGLGLTCAVTESYAAYCWGYNEFGSVGNGSRGDSEVPAPVVGSQAFVAVAVGLAHACGLDREGVVFCWGSNMVGQLGVNLPGDAEHTCSMGDTSTSCTSSPVRVVTQDRFRAISANWVNVCATNWFGGAVCWGLNDLGQVGNGGAGPYARIPIRVLSNHTYLEVRTGLSASCGLTPERMIECWGNGNPVPRQVPLPAGR